MNYTMLLAAFIITGIAVGAGIPASWTYIAEQAPADERARHVGTAQLAWSIGPLIGFALAAALAPLGLLGSRLIFLHLFVVAAVVWWIRQGLRRIADLEGRGPRRQQGRARGIEDRRQRTAWAVLPQASTSSRCCS